MSDFIHAGLLELSLKIETWLQAPEFEAEQVPETFAVLHSEDLSPALQLQTQRFSHPALLHLTWAVLSERDSGAYRAITLYALPKAHLGLPILGLDYVGLGGIMPIAALDLAPTDEKFWNDSALPALALLHQAHSDLIERKVPPFAKEVFSEKAFLVATKTESGCKQVIQRAQAIFEIYAPWLKNPSVSEIRQDERLRNWCLAMANNKKEAGALKRLFGPGAETYLQDYLFKPPVFTTSMD
jgi:hypothetical protein